MSSDNYVATRRIAQNYEQSIMKAVRTGGRDAMGKKDERLRSVSAGQRVSADLVATPLAAEPRPTGLVGNIYLKSVQEPGLPNLQRNVRG
jgi:hypothetical protein